MRIGSKVLAEVAVVNESESAMGSLAPGTTVWCSESLIEVPVMLSIADARRIVLLVADIGGASEADVVSTDVNNGDADRVLMTNGGWGLLLAAETSIFSLSETEFGSVSRLCNYIEVSVQR